MQDSGIPLADLTQHPSRRLVDEVVFVVEEPFGQGESRLETVLADESKRCDDGHALRPQITGLCHGVEAPVRTTEQVLPTILGATLSTMSQLSTAVR